MQIEHVLIPAVMEGHDYDTAPRISVVVGNRNMCSVDCYGHLYSWGISKQVLCSLVDDTESLLVQEHPTGLGHSSLQARFVVFPVRVGMFQEEK